MWWSGGSRDGTGGGLWAVTRGSRRWWRVYGEVGVGVVWDCGVYGVVVGGQRAGRVGGLGAGGVGGLAVTGLGDPKYLLPKLWLLTFSLEEIFHKILTKKLNTARLMVQQSYILTKSILL